MIAWLNRLGEERAAFGKRELHDLLALVKQDVKCVVDDVRSRGSKVLEEVEAGPAHPNARGVVPSESFCDKSTI